MRLISYASCILLVLILNGCAIKVSSSYPPSVLLEGSGKVNVSKITYIPLEYQIDNNTKQLVKKWKDEKGEENEIYLEPYQIDTGRGLNPIYLDRPIDEFITEAVKKELKFIGYKNTSEADVIISGNVVDLSVDYIGFSTVDFMAKIQFNVKNKQTGREYNKLAEGKYSSSKFTTMEFSPGIFAAIAKSIEDFVRSAQGNGML